MDLSDIVVPDGAVELGKQLVTCTVEGILEESDLRELMLGAEVAAAAAPEELDDPADLKKIRERHHSVARMIAGGLNQRMVSQLCGYTESYLSVLLNNPSMQELIELYRIQNGGGTALITEKLRTVGLKALEKLDQQLEAGNLSNNDLLQLGKLGLDRGGFGPQSKHHVVNETHLFDHSEIAARNKAALDRNRAYVVPADEVRKAIPQPEQNGETSGPMDKETERLPEDRSGQGLQEHRE
jgi:hypothetical protein